MNIARISVRYRSAACQHPSDRLVQADAETKGMESETSVPARGEGARSPGFERQRRHLPAGTGGRRPLPHWAPWEARPRARF